jgi:hypothetical protein
MAKEKQPQTVIKTEKDPNINVFGLKRKPIQNNYNGVAETRRYLGRASLYNRGGSTKDLSSFLNGSYLDPYFKDPESRLKDCITISDTLYSTNRIYQEVIDYLVDMYYWRTVAVPRQIKKVDGKKAVKTNKEEYMKMYHKMIEIVDGFNISSHYPKILLELFKNGRVNLYATGDPTSKSMGVIILPNEYCQPSVETQHGTTQVMFNFQFFDNIASSQTERDQVFGLFPTEFKELYDLYREKNVQWLPLNPKLSTTLSLNRIGFPTFLSIFYELIDYKNYKLNELDRNTNALERLVTQEIDLEKTGIELPEVLDLHDSIAERVDGNGTTTITSVGKLDVKQIQQEVGQENKALDYAYKGIYNNAGFNYEIFGGDSAESIQMSIQRDMKYVWRYIEQLVNFYNLAANNIYNFGEYQLSFRVLPISPYDEKEKLETYRANATLGVGVVDLIVASGTKQVDIESTLELEENLNLVSRLMPLQSSHVQSGATGSSSTADKDEKNKDSEEKEQEGQNQDTEKNPNKDVQKDENNPGKNSDEVQDSDKE